MTIYGFETTGSGFTVSDTSFVLLPGQTSVITVHTTIDTTNGKIVNNGGVAVNSDADAPINAITFSRNFTYPKDYSVRFTVNSPSGKNQDQVTMQIIADSLPQGLTQLSANLTVANTDLLSFVDYASPNQVSIIGNTVTITGRSEERRVGKECRSRW